MDRRRALLAGIAVVLLGAPLTLQVMPVQTTEFVIVERDLSPAGEQRSFQRAETYNYTALSPQTQRAVDEALTGGRYVIEDPAKRPPEFGFPGDYWKGYRISIDGETESVLTTAKAGPPVPAVSMAAWAIAFLGVVLLVALRVRWTVVDIGVGLGGLAMLGTLLFVDQAAITVAVLAVFAGLGRSAILIRDS